MQTRSVLNLALVLVAIGMATGFPPGSDTSTKQGTVNDARILAEKDTGNNWLVNGRINDSRHFSPLEQINDKNVADLALAWYLDIEGGMGVVSEPLVVDGVIYFSAPLSKVYAVDAASGKLLWKFDPQVRLNLSLNGSYSARTNGGVAVWNGKVYVGTGDCRLVAIDAATAKQVWEAKVCEPLQTGITGAPHVAKGKILMGFNGSDDGVRGALVAYDAETGKEVWRFWTVPGDPSKPYETKELEMAAKTWHGEGAWKIGGGDVWHCGRRRRLRRIGGHANHWRKTFLAMHHGRRRGNGKIRLALSDRHRRRAHREQSNCHGRPRDQRRTAPRGDERPQERILLHSRCEIRKAAFRQTADANVLGFRLRFANAKAHPHLCFAGRRSPVDGAQLVAHEL